MKKGLLVLLAFVSVLFLTACGGSGNKLVCTLSQVQATGLGDGYNMDMNSKVTMDFSNDQLSEMKMDLEVILQDKLYDAMKEQGDIDSQMNQIAAQIEASLTANAEYSDVISNKKFSYSGKTITINVEMDASKAQESKTRKDAIEHFEGQGYKCN